MNIETAFYFYGLCAFLWVGGAVSWELGNDGSLPPWVADVAVGSVLFGFVAMWFYFVGVGR